MSIRLQICYTSVISRRSNMRYQINSGSFLRMVKSACFWVFVLVIFRPFRMYPLQDVVAGHLAKTEGIQFESCRGHSLQKSCLTYLLSGFCLCYGSKIGGNWMIWGLKLIKKHLNQVFSSSSPISSFTQFLVFLFEFNTVHENHLTASTPALCQPKIVIPW